jgi:hypothetical protein
VVGATASAERSSRELSLAYRYACRVIEDLFRLLVVALLCLHGLTHVIWFLASWSSVPTGVRDGAWILPGDITIRGRAGKVFGLLALVVVILFVMAALMLLAGASRWSGVANLGIFLSFGVVVPWIRQGPGSWPAMAVVANLILMFLVTPELSSAILV